MRSKPTAPRLKEVWIVVQENEGLIIHAFDKHKAALSCAKSLADRCPCVRTEIAKYLIAPNSHKTLSEGPL